MLERPVSAAAWTDAEIVGKVDPDATQIVIGVLALGSGTSGYDNLEFSAQELDGTWRRVDIRDSGFEEASLTDVWHPGIGKPSSGNSTDGWLITLDHERPAVGASSLRIERATKLITEELFDEMPAAGEAIDIDLGSGLRAHVPLTLYSQAGHTTGDSLADARRGQTEPRTHPTGFDESAGIADVIVTWNVLEHFWPYWDMLPDVDWLAELDKALVDSFDDHSIADHVRTLERLTARAPDGHSFTTCPGDPKTGYLPFVLDYLEGRVVVMSSREKAVQPGDVIVAIDGQPVEHLLPEAESRISGSPQWRRVRGLQLLGVASRGSDASLVLERGGAHLSTRVARVDQAMMTEPLHSTIERYDDGVYYVDLSQATMQQLDAAMDKLAVAPGVIFDVRRRPNSNHQTLSHLLTQTDDSKWMAIPRIIRPDRPSSPAGWKTVGWNLPALAPHIQGRIAFLTGPDAISYAESVMGLVEYYRLGEIVGRPTAGSNGDAAEISQPTGCATRFTGRRVTKPNGARHYLYGVQPTISVSATIAGIRANRDEVLEAALAYVRKAIK
jgi:C-terminal processing protease CtpA/Prc